MTQFVKPYQKFGAISERTITKFTVVHEVPAVWNEESRDEFLFNLEAEARANCVAGHGVHYIILPDGELVRDRPDSIRGCLTSEFNRAAIYIRLPIINEDGLPSEEQEETLNNLLDDIEDRYGKTAFKVIKGWGALK
jgi:hypothetical protein